MTKKKTTKRALLVSALSLLMCVSMLIGSTFAWFTDSVSSNKNKIVAGNLDIELEYWNGTKWEDVTGASDILAGDRWEPGYVDIAYLRVKNAGSLALKYTLGVNIITETEGVNKEGKPFKLSDYIYYDVAEGVDGETNAYATREDAMAIATETTKISRSYTKVSTMEADSAYHYLAMVVYMPTTVGNEANHNGVDIPEIELGISVFATQYASETDSFDKYYDGEAFVPVAEVANLGVQTVNLVGGGNMKLDASFSFKTTEDEIAAAASGYRYWHADFVVSADATVKANSMALAGYYQAYADFTNTQGQWIALQSDDDIAANQEIRLMEFMGVTGNYEELCAWIPEFLCGAADLDGSNEGTTLTVELRLYETTKYAGDTSGPANIETGNYITVGVFTHTFGGNYVTLADNTVLFEANDGDVVLYDTQDVEVVDYTIPEGVTSVGNYAFSYNDTIKTVELASTVTELGRAFDSNTTIEKVILNEGLTEIGDRAFKATTALEEVEISSTVKTITANAFQKTGLKTIVIPATVEYIGETSFGASQIETVIFEGNTAIENKAFRGCAALRTVYMYGDDITFVNNTAQGNCWFCNSESNNPGVSNITFYIKNDAVAAKVKTAMGAEANNTHVIVCNMAGTASELASELAKGGNVLLTADIDATTGITLPENATIEGNGHTITYTGTDYTYHLVKLSTNATLKNVTLENYRVRTEATTNGTVTLENVVINMDNDETGLDISRGAGTAKLTNVQCKGIQDATHLDPSTSVQIDYTPYGDVLLGTKWGLEATDCEFGSLHGWNTTNGSNVYLTNTTATVFRMHYWSNRTLYIDGVQTAWSESGAIPVAHDVGGCWSVQPAFR